MKKKGLRQQQPKRLVERLKRRVIELTKAVAEQKQLMSKIYEYFTGGMQGLGQSIGTAMQLQELLIDAQGWDKVKVKELIEAKAAQRKAEAEAKNAEAETKAAADAALKAAEPAPKRTEAEAAKAKIDQEVAEHNARIEAAKNQAESA